MTIANRTLSSVALSALTGTMLFAATALAQNTPAPDPNAASQPATAQPGSEAQPYGAQDQTAPGAMTSPNATGSSRMSSPQANAPMTASAGMPLTQVKNAKATLATASLQDSSGQPIGQVTTVHTTKRGTPTTIDVTLTGGQSKTVAIKASSLRYDETSNTLKTDLTSSELQSLPTASGT
ncbi:MAG: hypothetical protein ABSD74_13750 [Rhizomicrobium sp.]|jgi:hypothetical protein